MEFELDGHTYRTGKLDARAQFHIMRRLAPVLGEIAPALQGNAKGVDSLPAIAAAVAKLSDADADYCIFGLLKVVSRKQPNGLGWGAVSVDQSLMYDDIDMAKMLKLAWESMTSNMSGFFAALPSDFKEAAQKAKGQ